MRMSRQEALAEVTQGVMDARCRNHPANYGGCTECSPIAEEVTDAALSWLASVLADDATVEVVARAMLPEGEGFLCAPWERVGTVNRSRYRRLATAGLAVLSAHLAAPAPGGVAARKQEATS